MRPELILASILAASVSALEARQAQQTPQLEYLSQKSAYETGTVYTLKPYIPGPPRFYGTPYQSVAPALTTSTRPNEEFPSPLTSQIKHITESSTTTTSKATPLPSSSGFSKLREGLNSTSTTSSRGPRKSIYIGKDKNEDELVDQASRKGEGKGGNEKDSSAGAALSVNGNSITGALIGLGILFM